MSEKIDKKVVELEFDNAKFKTGIAETIQAIKNLDSNLTLKNGIEGLRDITVASSKIDFSDIIQGTDEVGSKLAGLKGIAETAFSGIQSIASTFMKGAGIAGLLTSLPVVGQSISGGISRAQRISQAKFTMEGLGVEWKDIVNDINNSVDGTAYGLDQAASAASQLVASGVQTGEQMETVLKSIAGLAAMTGSDYDGIANIMTTIAGQGKVMTGQLRQLEARGFNAAASLTTFMRQFEGFEDLTEAGVREMVEDGMISFDLFSSAMEQYADQAAKANNTFNGAMSNIKAALSRTTADFFEEVMGVSGLVPVLNDVRQVINGLNKATNILMHNTVDEETGEISRYGTVIKGVLVLLQQVHKAFTDIALVEEKDLNGNTVIATKFFDRWKNVFELLSPTISKFFRMLQDGVYNLTAFSLNMSSAIAELLRILLTLLTPVIQAFDYVFGTTFGDLTAIFRDGSASLVEFLETIKPSDAILSGIRTVFLGIFNIVKLLVTLLAGPFVLAFQAFMKVGELATVVAGFLHDRFVDLTSIISDVGSSIGGFFGELFESISNISGGTINRIVEFFAPITDFISEVAKGGNLSNGINRLFGSITDSVSSFDTGGVTSWIGRAFDGVKDFLSPFGNLFTQAFANASEFLSNIDFSGSVGGFVSFLTETIGGIPDIFKIGEAFGSVADSVNDAGGEVDDLGSKMKVLAEIARDSLISGLTNAFSYIGARATDIWNVVGPVLTNIRDGAVSLFGIVKTAIENSGISLEPVIKLVTDLGESVGKFFKDISENGISLDTFFKLFSDLESSGSSFINEIGPKFTKAFDEIGTSINEQLNGPFGEFYTMLVNIGTTIAGLPDAITNIPNAIGTFLSDISGAIRNPFSVEKAYADDGLNEGIDDVSETGFDLVKAFSDFVKLMKKPLDTAQEFFTGTFSGVTESIGEAIDAGINAINLENIKSFLLDVGSIGALAGTIWGIYEFDALMKSARGLIDGIGGLLEGIKTSVETLSKTIKDFGNTLKTEIRANAFLKYVMGFATSILILAGAMYLISTIDSDRLLESALVLGGLMLLMGALIALFEFLDGDKMKKYFSSNGGSSGVATIVALSVSMLILAQAVRMLGSLDPGELQQGTQYMLYMMIMLGIMAAVVEAVSGMGDISGAATLLGMAVGILALSFAVQYLSSNVEWGALMDGLGKAALLVGALILALFLLNKATKEMLNSLPVLIGLAIGIMAIAGALVLLDKATGDNPDKLAADIIVLTLGIIALATALSILSGFEGSMVKGGAGITIMAAALIEIAIALAVLDAATKGDPLNMALQLIVLCGALGIMAYILSTLGTQAPKTTAAATSLLIMAAALGVFVGIMLILGVVASRDMGVIVAGIITLVVTLAVFAGLVGLLGLLATALSGLTISLTTLGFALALITGAFLAFSLGLVFLSSLAPEAFANIADGLVAFADRIAASGDSIVRSAQIIGESLAAGVVAFFARIATDIGNGITTLASSIEGQAPQIGNSAKSIGKALVTGIVAGLAGIGEAVLGGVVSGVTGIFGQASEVMAANGTAASYEMAQAMSENPDQYVDVGRANMEKVAEGMENSDAGKEAGAEAADNVGEAYEEELPAATEGVDASEALAVPIENADPGPTQDAFNDLLNRVLGSEDGFGDLSAIGSAVPETLISSILDGSSGAKLDASALFSNIGLSPESLGQPAKDVGGNVGESVVQGTSEKLADTAAIDGGMSAQINTISTYSEQYRQAGTSNGEAYTSGVTSSIDASSISGALSAVVDGFESTAGSAGEAGTRSGQMFGAGQVEAISAMSSVVAMTARTNIYAAAEGSDSRGAGNQSGNNFADGSVESIAAKVGELTAVVTAMFWSAASDSDPGGKGYTAGTWFGNGAQSGVSNSISGIASIVSGALDSAARDADPGGIGHTAGEWFAGGLISGMQSRSSEVYWAGYDLGKEAQRGYDDATETASPSKVMFREGRWFDEGLMLGITEYSSQVSEAAGSMGEDAVDSASSAFSLMGDIIDQVDWDSDPVITPVLDLDTFIADAETMSSFMPDGQVEAGGYINRLSSQSVDVSNVQNDQSPVNIYVTLDWRAGATANEMVSQLADELKVFNLTRGK